MAASTEVDRLDVSDARRFELADRGRHQIEMGFAPRTLVGDCLVGGIDHPTCHVFTHLVTTRPDGRSNPGPHFDGRDTLSHEGGMIEGRPKDSSD